jgi:hypothetical protein
MASDTANPVRLMCRLFAELKREAGEVRTPLNDSHAVKHPHRSPLFGKKLLGAPFFTKS